MRPLLTSLPASLPAVALLLATMGHSPEIQPDSPFRLLAAQAIADGHGISTPFPQQPEDQFAADGGLILRHRLRGLPGYPVAVGLTAMAADVDPIHAAAIVNLVALMAFVAAVASLALAAGLTPGSALLAATIAGLLPATQSTFRMATSEPLFVAMAGWALVALARFQLQTDDSGRHWMATTVLALLATTVRFLGVAIAVVQLAVAGLIATGERRLGRHTLFATVGAWSATGGLLLWLAPRPPCVSCDDGMIAAPGALTTLKDLASSVLHEQPLIRAVPGQLDLVLSLIALLAAVAAMHRAPRLERWRPQVGFLLGAAGVAYVLLLFVLRLVIHFGRIDRRLIGPGMVLAGAGVLIWLLRDLSTRRARIGAALLLTLSVAVVWTEAAWRDTSWWWNNAPALSVPAPFASAAQRLARRAKGPILTTDPETVAFISGRPAYWVGRPDVLARFAARADALVLMRLDDQADVARNDAVIRWLDENASPVEDGLGYRAWQLHRNR